MALRLRRSVKKQNLLYFSSLVENTLCDVVLQVGRSNFRAHRNVLACTSAHLMELFTEEDAATRTHFKLPNVDPDAFSVLLDYAYTARFVNA